MRGYTRIFENMLLDNPAITIRLNVDFFKARAAPTHTLHPFLTTPYTPRNGVSATRLASLHPHPPPPLT